VSQYDAVASRALALIARKGAAIAFLVVTAGTPDPTTGLPPTSTTTTVMGSAVEIPGDAADREQYIALGLIQLNPVTLYVAGSGLAATPAPGMRAIWAGKDYTIKLATRVAIDGVSVILWQLVAVA
jgi:hypothetical protein